MSAKSFRLLIFLVVCVSCVARSQDYYDDDARLWLYLKLNKKLTEKIKIELLIQNKLNNNAGEYSRGSVNPELSYKVSKKIRFVAGYSFTKKRELEGYYTDVHQAYAGIILRRKYKKLVFTYRNLLQEQFYSLFSETTDKPSVFYERNKLAIHYELTKRFELYVSGEINSQISPYPQLSIQRSRTSVGTQINLSKRAAFDLYFLFQQKFSYKGLRERGFIYGITFSYDL